MELAVCSEVATYWAVRTLPWEASFQVKSALLGGTPPKPGPESSLAASPSPLKPGKQSPPSVVGGAVELDEVEVTREMHHSLVRVLDIDDKIFDNAPFKQVWAVKADTEISGAEYFRAFAQARTLPAWKQIVNTKLGVDLSVVNAQRTRLHLFAVALQYLDATTFQKS